MCMIGCIVVVEEWYVGLRWLGEDRPSSSCSSQLVGRQEGEAVARDTALAMGAEALSAAQTGTPAWLEEIVELDWVLNVAHLQFSSPAAGR